MPQGFTPGHNHFGQTNYRRGSVLLTLGWILLWMTALTGMFAFQDIREGTYFWVVWSAIQGALGLGLVLAGSHYRHKFQS